jgi:hypothetical protein
LTTIVDELVRCKPWLEAALERSGGTHTLEDVVQSIQTGAMQFWPAPRGCAVTEVVNYPQKKVLHIFLAGGEMDQIIDMDSSAVEFAKMNGCTGMSIAGRKGWAKVLKNKGYEETFTVLGKDI